ncbi:MAG TPA: ACP S-malonyltransferase [Polyangia bacterium]|nr:ACP S-malonyltransferase [Polyangia bacterium]
MRAFLFPGQGSQKVGMAAGLARDRLREADDALGFQLSKIIDEGPEAELTRTANTQPAILTVSIAIADSLRARGVEAQVAAGHSLGEYSALVYAGVLGFADAVRLVHLRGKFMQEAVPEGVGAMAAIVGLDASTVRDTCREASPDATDACQPANLNGGGQVVIAGHKAAVERAMALAKQKGAKLVKALPVSAPFHSALMAPAAEKLRAEFERVKLNMFKIPVVSNVTAEPNSDHARVKELLYAQVTGSVRWEESVQAMAKLGVDEAYEVGPGKVLAGLVKRIAPSIALKEVAGG